MRTTLLPAALVSALLIASCSSDGDGDTSTEGSAAPDTAVAETEADDGAAEPEPDDGDDAEASEEAEPEQGETEVEPAPPEPTSGTATLTLENGETFEVDVFCTLEPQISAGSEILFTATSTGNPILDITQFGDEGPVTDTGTVSLIDGETIEPLWGASTMYEPFGGSLELSLDGSTINGSGDFYAGDDPVEGGDPVPGEVVANC